MSQYSIMTLQLFIRSVMPLKNEKRRIALFGGTFNPVHNGHLSIACEARDRFNIDKILFLPCAVSPHKTHVKTVSADHRIAMLHLALDRLEWAAVSRMEIDRGGVSYAYDTLKAFRESYPGCKPFFIIGMDSLLELHLWYRSGELVVLCDFITFLRPGVLNKESVQDLGFDDSVNKRLLNNIVEGPLLDISSSKIRDLIAEGESAKGMLPVSVETYIREHSLYSR